MNNLYCKVRAYYWRTNFACSHGKCSFAGFKPLSCSTQVSQVPYIFTDKLSRASKEADQLSIINLPLERFYIFERIHFKIIKKKLEKLLATLISHENIFKHKVQKITLPGGPERFLNG